MRGTFVGEVSPEYLWGSLDQSMPSLTTRVVVMDDSGHIIFSSAKALPIPWRARRDQGPGGGGRFGRPFISVGCVRIRMTEAFASQPWRVVLSESKDEVLEPMVEFTNTFLIVVGLSSLVVLLLSVSQIRRSVLAARGAAEGHPPDCPARFRQPGHGDQPG